MHVHGMSMSEYASVCALSVFVYLCVWGEFVHVCSSLI